MGNSVGTIDIEMPEQNPNIPGSRRCEIVMRGEFGELITATFVDAEVEETEGRTVMRLLMTDESHFYGVINRLHELSVDVVSLREISSPP